MYLREGENKTDQTTKKHVYLEGHGHFCHSDYVMMQIYKNGNTHAG